MSYDGIVVRAVVNELREKLLGGRVDKIYQQEKDELLIQIYSKGNNYRLLVSASSNFPRLYLTSKSKKNPEAPPMFCMLLRKHLIGGNILNIEQSGMDRVIIFTISGTDDLGHPLNRNLIVEIMGKHSNIILTEDKTSKIVDSIKRIPIDVSRVRQVLPGLQYHLLISNDKFSPLNVDFISFKTLIDSSAKNVQVNKFIYQNFIGLSPLIGKAISQNSNIEPDRTLASLSDVDIVCLYNEFASTMSSVYENRFSPIIAINEETGEIEGFHALPLPYFGTKGIIHHSSVSGMLDEVYSSKDSYDRVSQKSSSIKKIVHSKLDRALNKLSKLKEEMMESMDRDKYKVYADLIQSNLNRIAKGSHEIELENYYDPNLSGLLVPLDEKLGGAENAQKYYKKYSKLKTASILLAKQIKETQEEISYLENVLVSLENSTEVFELDEIKTELASEGYIAPLNKRGKKIKEKPSNPHNYISSDGVSIYVGRNNRQNEYLTMKIAKKDDMWLHAKGIPGSHVIIKTDGKVIPPNTLEEAAKLAAWYSKSRNSSNIEVDYTLRKNVKKPGNSKPGFVYYDGQQTLIVTPTAMEIGKMKKVDA
jgi:predicted ribosome quality control (RQC) complex YloA/Tae2 family protein